METTQKNASASGHELEKLRLVIEQTPGAIIILDKNFVFEYVNPSFEKLSGFQKEELLTKTVAERFQSEEISEAHNQLVRSMLSGQKWEGELLSHRKDGSRYWVNTIASPYRDDAGKMEGYIIIQQDVTKQREVEKALRESQINLLESEKELREAKDHLEKLNKNLESRIQKNSKRLTEARTQLLNLQKENIQSQFEVLKQQVNPHFLFNSLNVLTSLIKIEPDLAEKFSEQLSRVYRYVLENKDHELVDLNTELQFLDAYLFLLNIRFLNKLNVNIQIPAERRSDLIIPLAMQLLIENAIKHNVMSKNKPLTIDLFLDEDSCIHVVNNLQERPTPSFSTGIGLKNIQNRCKLLQLKSPVFSKTNTHFIAIVPLVRVD